MTPEELQQAVGLMERSGLERSRQMLLQAGDALSATLRRVTARVITPQEYVLLVDWGASLRISRSLSHNTASNYVDSVARFGEWLNAAERGLESATAAMAEAWMRECAVNQHESTETLHLRLVAVRQFYVWREGQTGVISPMRSMKGPKRDDRSARKYSKAQLKKIFSSCDLETVLGRRDYAILLFFLYTGARRMEVASLTLQQIELRERVGAVRFVGKGSKERTVSFEGAVVDALKVWLMDRDAMGAQGNNVFVGIKGPKQYQALGSFGLHQVIRRAHRKARINLSDGMALHTLRVTFATALYDQKIGLEEIRDIMGHRDINTTRKYIAISERQLRTRLSSGFLDEIMGTTKKLPGYIEQHINRGRKRDDDGE